MQVEEEEITAKLLLVFVVPRKKMVTGRGEVNPRAKVDMMEAEMRCCLSWDGG
jgi:hypothetical protein